MTGFNCYLREHKTVVIFTVLAFLSMTFFSGCSKPNDRPQGDAVASETATQAADEVKPGAIPPTEDKNEGSDSGGVQSVAVPLEEMPVAERLDRFYRAIKGSSARIPHDTFDPRAVIGEIGTDPRAICEWIRDNTQLVPYRGILRGPVGVLMDRVGNSLDRSLLLAELLDLAGHNVLLAHVVLSPDQAVALLDKLPPSRNPSSRTGESGHGTLDEAIAEDAEAYGLDAQELQEIRTKLTQDSGYLEKETRERADAQSRQLIEAIGAFQDAEELKKSEHKANIESLRDHWWVRVDDGSSGMDLDPEAKEMRPVDDLRVTADIIVPDDLVEDLHHSVKIRLVIERWDMGSLTRETVLEKAVKPKDHLGDTIAIRHIPASWPEDMSVFAESDGKRKLKKTILEETEWLPVLFLGSEPVLSASFKDTGEVNKEPRRKTGGGIGGIAGGVFGALGGTEEESKAKKDTVLTAEWIEYEISSPGRPVRVIAREIFDLVGPASRQNGDYREFRISESQRLARGSALMAEFDILLQACEISPEFTANLMISRMLDNWDGWSELLLGSQSTREHLGHLKQITPLPGPGYGFTSARQEWSSVRKIGYLGSPNIAVFIGGLRPDVDGEFVSYRAFDIVENRLEILPSAEISSLEARLRQGVLDTNVEATLIKCLGQRGEGTALMFEESSGQDIKWVALRNTDERGLKQLLLPKDARARIQADLAAGHIVLAPQKGLEKAGQLMVSWWRIDPKTGQTLGISANGLGQALSQYVLTSAKVMGWSMCAAEFIEQARYREKGQHTGPGWGLLLCTSMGAFSAFQMAWGVHNLWAWSVVFLEYLNFFGRHWLHNAGH